MARNNILSYLLIQPLPIACKALRERHEEQKMASARSMTGVPGGLFGVGNEHSQLDATLETRPAADHHTTL